jgi:hypothetical protein
MNSGGGEACFSANIPSLHKGLALAMETAGEERACCVRVAGAGHLDAGAAA